MKKRKFCIFILMLVVMLFLTGCKENNKENLNLEKALSEIRFIENQSITIFNKYLNGEYHSTDGSDWNLLKEDSVMLNSSIDVIIMDLASVSIPSKDIVELESHFRNLDIQMQDENIDKYMKEICDIYYFVSTTILDNISQDKIIKQEKKCKAYSLYIGYYVITLQKENALSIVNTFQEDYSKLSISQEYLDNNSYKVNKIFINIQKLKSLIEDGNVEKIKVVLNEIFNLF